MFFSYVYNFGFLLSLLLIYLLYKVRKSHLGPYLLTMTLFTSFWLLSEGASYLFTDHAPIIFLQKAKYLSIITIGPLMLLTSLVFTFGNIPRRRLFLAILFLVPVLSLLSLASNRFPYAFVTQTSISYDRGILLYNYTRGPGFWVNMVYAYLTLFTSNIVLAYKFVTSPKLYKNQSFVVAAGSIASTVLNVVFITSIMDQIQIDTTPYSVLISMFIFYWGLYVLPANTLLVEARGLVLENLSDLIIILDDQQNIVDVNSATRDLILQVSDMTTKKHNASSDYINIPYEKLLDHLPLNQEKKQALLGGEDTDFKFTIDGKVYYYSFHRQSILDEANRDIGELVILHNITDQHNHIEELLNINKELLISDAIIRDAREAILVLDRESLIINANQSMLDMSGYSQEDLIGNPYNMLRSDQHDIVFYVNIWDSVTSKGFWEGEVWDQRKNGEVYPKWMSFTQICNDLGQVLHYVIIATDRTKLKKAETDLKHLAYYDSLTSLPNRTLFMDRLKIAIARATRNQNHLALLFIDLDHFKDINDHLGHTVGDQLLIQVANTIKSQIQESDTLCRLGGDEFTLILEDIDQEMQVEAIAQKIIKAFERPIHLNGSEISVTLSIGIAIGPETNETDEQLISRADMAMYQAKEANYSHYCFISEEIEEERRRLHKINQELRKAFNNKEFQLYLQPQISLVNDKVALVGAEALIRWFKADGTMVPPAEFIPVAETNGMIHDIGLWVIEELFRINTLLRQEGIALNLSVNVSIMQFESPDFLKRIHKVLHQNKNTIDLTIEITESLFFKDLEKGIGHLKALKALGFSIAMDDFGTGFSSLSYLNRLPIDYLKIDKSFIDELSPDEHEHMAFAIITMAQMLKMKTVAEGVETQMQASKIIDAGCDIIQGFLYSKPLPLDDFVDYAKRPVE